MRTRSSYSFFIASAFLSASALCGASCEPLECGEGTREDDRKCVPTTYWATDGGVRCGQGTALQGSECIPLEELCGEFTRPEPAVDENGNPIGGFICVGEEGGLVKPPECPDVTTPGVICVNGFVRWFLDDAGKVLETAVADPEAPEDGTTLEVRVYDPLQYAINPNVAPLGVGEVNPRNGTFVVDGIVVPATNAIALVVDEVDTAPGDVFAFTGIPYLAGSTNLTGLNAAAITNAQEAEWTSALGGDPGLAATGCPAPVGGGERTLATCGTWIGVFRTGTQEEPGDPVEGVIPWNGASAVAANRTFYLGISGSNAIFDDPAAGAVWTDGDGPHEWTGQIGVTFVPGASLGTWFGECAPGTPCATAGCTFPDTQSGGAAPGALFVQYVFPTNACTLP